MINNIPALLLSEELKRKYAKQEVEKAIEIIRKYGPLAGVSGRSMFEYIQLSSFMIREINRESKCKEDVGGSSEERELQTDNGRPI